MKLCDENATLKKFTKDHNHLINFNIISNESASFQF